MQDVYVVILLNAKLMRLNSTQQNFISSQRLKVLFTMYKPEREHF